MSECVCVCVCYVMLCIAQGIFLYHMETTETKALMESFPSSSPSSASSSPSSSSPVEAASAEGGDGNPDVPQCTNNKELQGEVALKHMHSSLLYRCSFSPVSVFVLRS